MNFMAGQIFWFAFNCFQYVHIITLIWGTDESVLLASPVNVDLWPYCSPAACGFFPIKNHNFPGLCHVVMLAPCVVLLCTQGAYAFIKALCHPRMFQVLQKNKQELHLGPLDMFLSSSFWQKTGTILNKSQASWTNGFPSFLCNLVSMNSYTFICAAGIQNTSFSLALKRIFSNCCPHSWSWSCWTIIWVVAYTDGVFW